jgi:hypothetical protein
LGPVLPGSSDRGAEEARTSAAMAKIPINDPKAGQLTDPENAKCFGSPPTTMN